MKEDRINELVQKLNKASDAYYNDNAIMENYEFDLLYDELVALEKETGIILPDSPTQRAGYKTVSVLEKVKHEFPALSLDKTKDISEFPILFNTRDKKAIVMWKEDGSTIVATYQNGNLVLLATRGGSDDNIGLNITHNAPYIKGLPMHVPYEGKMVIRGEAVMSYEEFNRINAELPPNVKQYENPRNLANASISMKDSGEMSKREICFKGFTLVYTQDKIENDSFENRFHFMEKQGISLVEYEVVPVEKLVDCMNHISAKAESYQFPVDGLVVAANDVIYAESQPGTNRHPNKLVGYALKWEDEIKETILREIEWSASRTGLINPVAVFDPVRLEGTTVTRATLHNVSFVQALNLLPNDRISIYKANKIIPKVYKNLDENTHGLIDIHKLVSFCPVCKQPTIIQKSENSDTIVAICPNPDCTAKQEKRFIHFCAKSCMNIFGLSEASLAKFINEGFLKKLPDIYTLDSYKNKIIPMEGFGQKSYDNIWDAIQKSRHTTFVKFVHALGIPNIGNGQAKLLDKAYNGDIKTFFTDVYNRKGFQQIDGIGEVLENSLWTWGNTFLRWIPFENSLDEINKTSINTEVLDLLKFLEFEQSKANGNSEENHILEGKTFVITGNVYIYKNQLELQEKIESLGGRLTGSVTGKTSYLINNDINSTSGKNKKANALNVPIISEKDFEKMIK